MITAAYCATMARYNLWQNASLIAAADTLNDGERTRNRGAFFGSISGTLSHLLWGDLVWMSRFEGGERPAGGIRGSAELFPDWDDYRRDRAAADTRILDWATGLAPDALEGDLVWNSGATGRNLTRPLAFCVAHFFNHQAHHRGQVHAMLTAAGVMPQDTDLFLMPDALA